MAILASQTKTGISWVGESVALFKQSPRKWLLVALAYIGLFVILPTLPGLQFLMLATVMIWPLSIAVIMKLYRNAELQKTESLSAVIKSMQTQMNPLLILGLICLVYFFIVNIILGSDGDFLAELAKNKGTMTEQQMAEAMGKGIVFLIKMMLLLLPLIVVTWFSPMLIAFNRYPLIKAMKSSIAGTLQYVVALTAAWLLLTTGFVLLTLMIGVVVGIFAVMMPAFSQSLVTFLTFGSLLVAIALMLSFQYVSYRDVFRAA